jgi:hypothetical protein
VATSHGVFVIVEDQARHAAVRTCFEAAIKLHSGSRWEARHHARLKLSGLDDAPCQVAVFTDHATAQVTGSDASPCRRRSIIQVAIAITLWLARGAAEASEVGWVKADLDSRREWRRGLGTAPSLGVVIYRWGLKSPPINCLWVDAPVEEGACTKSWWAGRRCGFVVLGDASERRRAGRLDGGVPPHSSSDSGTAVSRLARCQRIARYMAAARLSAGRTQPRASRGFFAAMGPSVGPYRARPRAPVTQ